MEGERLMMESSGDVVCSSDQFLGLSGSSGESTVRMRWEYFECGKADPLYYLGYGITCAGFERQGRQ